MVDKKIFIMVTILTALTSIFNSCAIGVIDNGNQVLGANHATSTMVDSDGEVYINRCSVLFFHLIKQCRIQKLKNSVFGYYTLQPIYVKAKDHVYKLEDAEIEMELRTSRANKK